MKEKILVCLVLSVSNGDLIEKEFDFGNEETLSLGFDTDLNNALMRDTEDTPDHIEHDCNTIRPFDEDNLIMEDWILQGRTQWKQKNGANVKYNHAYGIPIIGKAHFSDDSMRRACYLVRFLFADNEQFRRYAYQSKLYIIGDKGGVGCNPNVGNSGLSCPCEKYPYWKTTTKDSKWKKTDSTIKFPIRQIKTSAHEMAHYYIKYVLPLMYAAGKLELPKFINSPEWSWTTPYDGPYEDGTSCENIAQRRGEQGPVFDFLWNSLQQAHMKKTSNIDRCKNHHYFIYSGQDKFLGLESGGKPKENLRKECQEKNENLFNLLEIIWPCNNQYIAVCEDSAYGMTKGLAQKLLIGKSDPANPSNMICEDIDISEIDVEDMDKLSSPPTSDVTEEDKKTWYRNKCRKVAKKAGFLAEDQRLSALDHGVVASSLDDSSEYGWWLRKCCAKSAKFC